MAEQVGSAGANLERLRRLYEVKIAGTVLLWCLPLSVQPQSLMTALDLNTPIASLFLRLLAIAYLALCVGYGLGWRAAGQGVLLTGPLWVGLVSNGGACVLLTAYGSMGAWNNLPPTIQSALWLSAASTALITLGLWLLGLQRRQHGMGHAETV